MATAQSAHETGAAGTQGAARMTREQSKANTRERLLAAARSAFASHGFHGASVEEIASRAGFSTGALYSNFDGKEDLFLVLMEREIDEHAREITEAVRRRSSMADRATGGARQWMTMIDREPELLLLFMEFWAYGVRDPGVRPKVAARWQTSGGSGVRVDRPFHFVKGVADVATEDVAGERGEFCHKRHGRFSHL